MRVKQIKEELEALGAPHSDAFEKDDLVQRLIDARKQGGDEAGEGPTREQVREGTEMFIADPTAPDILRELENNTKLREAAMDIAMNGDASKYKDDAEVMEFMTKLEGISKRGMGGE